MKVLTSSLKALTNGEKVNYFINQLVYPGDSHVSVAQDSKSRTAGTGLRVQDDRNIRAKTGQRGLESLE